MAVRLAMIVTSDTDDIFLNQAAEAQLAAKLPEGAAALFLWSNARTVVIGRNQDARAECDIALLESEGGRLARRLSGGGAVVLPAVRPVYEGGNGYALPCIVCKQVFRAKAREGRKDL